MAVNFEQLDTSQFATPQDVQNLINDSSQSANTTYSSQKIMQEVDSVINDNAPSESSTYSSQKITDTFLAQDGDASEATVAFTGNTGEAPTSPGTLATLIGWLVGTVSGIEFGDGDAPGSHYIKFAGQNLMICFGTFTATCELSQNGTWYTGSSSQITNGTFAQAFGTLISLNISLSQGDWATILNQTAGNTGVTNVVLGYSSAYSSRDFRFDYVAFGTIS